MAGRNVDGYSGLQISAERVAALRDTELSDFFKELLRPHAYRTGVPADAAFVNAEEKAKDDGCDAWSGPADNPDEWLGSEVTCWQLKAGEAGEPSRLKGEAKKRIPHDTLASGGRFVVAASGSTSGKKGQDDRRKVIEGEARDLGLPVDKISVLGSERLAEWCNEHPALAWKFAGNTTSVVTLDRWAKNEQHRVEWQATEAAQTSMDAARQDLDLNLGHVQHLHIEGPPGVGKTRFALELCKGAAWSADVVYVRQAAEVDVDNIVQIVADAPGSRLVVVADEVQQHQLAPLRDSVGYAEGRVRLLTIGHSRTPDPDTIPSIRISPLDDDQMGKLIRAWHGGMPREHVEFVVRFADGYVRLAQLAANAVAKNPTGSVKDLLDQEHIRGFFDGMLGTGDRRPLYVVAALSTVGWEAEISKEGEAIAAHFGLDWKFVQTEVERFDRRLGIAPRGGRRRYISPTPLAAHLAVEAWAAMPGAMRSLPDVLPSDSARDAYYERIRTIATTAFARDFAMEDLRAFFELAAFRTESDIKRWAALSAAAPLLAANGALTALRNSSIDERREIKGSSRRHLLSGLMSLASREETFREAAISIALLAEAENETYSNNATGEFSSLFQVRLGGTAAPYSARIRVADEIQAIGRDSLTRIVVGALATAAETHETRIRDLASFGQPEEIEWRPKTYEEHVDCIVSAIDLLQRIQHPSSASEQALIDVVPDFVQLLWIDGVRPSILVLMRHIAAASVPAQKAVSIAISRYIHNEEQYWKRLTPSAAGEISRELSEMMPTDFLSRLERDVGTSPWDKSDEFSFQDLASEFVGNPNHFKESIGWLTSGDAADAWRFGKLVAEVGELSSLLKLLKLCEEMFGPDLRFVLAVVETARERLGESWYESWIASLDLRSPRQIDLLFESIWRLGAVDESLRLAGNHLSSASRSSILGLGYGTWYQQVKSESLASFLEKLMEAEGEQVVLSIVDQLTKDRRPGEAVVRLVDRLLASTELVRSRETMAEYHWKELALRFLDTHVDAVLKTILRAHTTRDSASWFVEFSQVKEVLEAIAHKYPKKLWAQVRPYLEDATHRGLFPIGFPKGLFLSVPYAAISEWIRGNPKDRAGLIIRLIGVDFSNESSLSMLLMNEFGGQPGVDEAFFAAYVSGGWSGPASLHWFELADSLDQLINVRSGYFQTWAKNAVQSLRDMGGRDRKREDEEEAVWKNR